MPVSRPLTLAEKIVQTKQQCNNEAKQIARCAYIFIAIGLIWAFYGAYEMTDSRRMAAFIKQTHQLPFGNKNYTNFTMANATDPTEGRLEIVLYDSLMNMNMFFTVSSVFLIVLGKIALRSSNKLKSRVANNMFNKYFFAFLVFLVFYVFTKKQGAYFAGVYTWMLENKNITTPAAAVDINETIATNTSTLRHLKFADSQVEYKLGDMQFDDGFVNAMGFGQQDDIPIDAKNIMEMHHRQHAGGRRGHGRRGGKHGGHGRRHHNKKGGRFGGKRNHPHNNRWADDYEEDHPATEQYDDGSEQDYERESVQDLKNFRKAAHRMFAPGMIDEADLNDDDFDFDIEIEDDDEVDEEFEQGPHHGPRVKASKKKWGKKRGHKKFGDSKMPLLNVSNVFYFFIIASIHQLVRIKFLEKYLAKLEFLKATKKLGEKKEKGTNDH